MDNSGTRKALGMDRMSESYHLDDIVKVRRFRWTHYIATLVALILLGALPGIMYGADVLTYFFPYGVWYIIYCAVIASVFCLVTATQKRRTFDMPMQKLSKAAKKVAAGDFSVYVEPDHTVGNRDYIDVMFQDFNKMVEALGSLETLKSDFISNVSHEFKTPLSVIDSYATALEKDNLTPEQRMEYISTVKASTQKLASLVTNILKLNKIENQVIQLSNETYDLIRQLSDSIISFEQKLDEKGLELIIEMDDRLMVHADPGMLEIVWQNILSNAIKFSEPGGTITIKQASNMHTATISVADTGCGMDEQTRRHLFDKFYQGNTTKAIEGNGLGMALTQKVIDLVGGNISVSSQPGSGTTFIVELPINTNSKL